MSAPTIHDALASIGWVDDEGAPVRFLSAGMDGATVSVVGYSEDGNWFVQLEFAVTKYVTGPADEPAVKPTTPDDSGDIS